MWNDHMIAVHVTQRAEVLCFDPMLLEMEMRLRVYTLMQRTYKSWCWLISFWQLHHCC